MDNEHKLASLASIALAVLFAIGIVVAGFNMQADKRAAMVRECLASNERMVNAVATAKSDALRWTSLPSCEFR